MFAGMVSEAVQKKLGDKYTVSVVTNVKNNAVEFTGITFHKQTERAAPTIYIDDLYEEYIHNRVTLEDAVREVLERYQKSTGAMTDIYQLSMNFEKCKGKIIYRLVSRERNKNMLENMPYIPFLNMAITFHLVVSIDNNYMQTLKIGNEIQKKWNVSVEQLFKLAKKNTPELLPPDIGGLRQFVSRYTGMEEQEELVCSDLTNSEKIDMIVVSNKLGVNGAAVILYDGVMENLANCFGANLYLLPSSIHEVIVVPACDESMLERFSDMVKTINRRYVEADEVLSDRVFIYLKNEKKFV